MNRELKKIEEMSRTGNFVSHLKYVPTSENIADAPSCALTDINCSLSDEAWARVQARFGPHTFDLMSTVTEEGMEACCLITRLGRPCILLTLMFSLTQNQSNIMSMSFPLSFSWDCCCDTFLFNASVSLLPSLSPVVPRLHPHRYRWAVFHAMAVDYFLLG